MAEEKQFEKRVKKFIEDCGGYFIKYWGGGDFTKSGVPDLLCCINGAFYGIELKARNGKPKPLQIYNLRRIHEAKGFAVLLYPDQFGLFKELVTLHKLSDIEFKFRYKTLSKRWMDWETKFKESGEL